MVNPRTVIVTGAARGIGAAIADMFARQGWNVASADFHFTDFDLAIPSTLAGPCDVREAESVGQFVRKTEDQFGPIDAVVNNAGIYPMQPFQTISTEDWRRVYNDLIKMITQLPDQHEHPITAEKF